jgi:hypothetical protein
MLPHPVQGDFQRPLWRVSCEKSNFSGVFWCDAWADQYASAFATDHLTDVDQVGG